MKALVTGGAGFIGSHLTEYLLEKGHHVIALDNLHAGRLSNFRECKDNPNLKFVKADIRTPDEISPHFEGVDWVFHLAALPSVIPSIESPIEYFEVNIDGTFNVLECARNANVKKVIYAGSSSCYGAPDRLPIPETAAIRPQHPYALTKMLGEQLVIHWEQVYKLPAISLRLFNVYGPRVQAKGALGAVFGIFLTQKLHNATMTVVGDGTQSRDFIFVKDVPRAFLLAAESDQSGEIFNVGSGSHYSINQIVDLLDGEAVHIPKRPADPSCIFADTTKIEKMLGFKAKTSFKHGVLELLNHIDDFRNTPLCDPKSIDDATKTWFKYLS